ncbi:hypothetical protein ACF2JD_18285 [Aeromonas sp. A-5]|uniref:hypothetical protein n=1 Tax=Aeromonas ichthyocola TaxID=3367746 RepID=UPI0038F03A08
MKLWRQPVDQDSVAALSTISRFHHGGGQRSADCRQCNPQAERAALQPAQRALAAAGQGPAIPAGGALNRQYSALVASLLLQMDEPRLLAQLADRLTGRKDVTPRPSCCPIRVHRMRGQGYNAEPPDPARVPA